MENQGYPTFTAPNPAMPQGYRPPTTSQYRPTQQYQPQYQLYAMN